MGAAKRQGFDVEMMMSEERDQKNAHYKNVVILHSTLPYQVHTTSGDLTNHLYQVAWCTDTGAGQTKFSKYFCTEVQRGASISNMDEAINAQLEDDAMMNRDTKGHVQMVEMTKRGISRPFFF